MYYIPITPSSGNLRGTCPECGCFMHRRVALAKLCGVTLEVTFPQAGPRIRERLVKLVPAEAVSAYPLLKPLADNVDKWAVWVLSWVLLLVVIVLRRYATATPQKGPQRAAVAVAAISFVIWVYVMKGDFGFYELGLKLIGGVEAPAPEKLELAKQFLSSLALVVWTLLVPVFYKGEAT